MRGLQQRREIRWRKREHQGTQSRTGLNKRERTDRLLYYKDTGGSSGSHARKSHGKPYGRLQSAMDAASLAPCRSRKGGTRQECVRDPAPAQGLSLRAGYCSSPTSSSHPHPTRLTAARRRCHPAPSHSVEEFLHLCGKEQCVPKTPRTAQQELGKKCESLQ